MIPFWHFEPLLTNIHRGFVRQSSWLGPKGPKTRPQNMRLLYTLFIRMGGRVENPTSRTFVGIRGQVICVENGLHTGRLNCNMKMNAPNLGVLNLAVAFRPQCAGVRNNGFIELWVN